MYLFSAKLARARGAQGIEIRDLLAGLYLSASERLGRYWDEWERLEDFVVSECDLEQPRFFYWFGMWESLQDREGSMEGLISFADETSEIIREANILAAKHGWDETRLEHLLGALAGDDCTDLCRRFVASGMKIDLVRSRMQRPQKG